MPWYSAAKEITIFLNKVNDFGIYVEPQEAEGSLRLHNFTVLSNKQGMPYKTTLLELCL